MCSFYCILSGGLGFAQTRAKISCHCSLYTVEDTTLMNVLQPTIISSFSLMFAFVFKLWCTFVCFSPTFILKISSHLTTSNKKKGFIVCIYNKKRKYTYIRKRRHFSAKYVKFTETILSSLILIIHEFYSEKSVF